MTYLTIPLTLGIEVTPASWLRSNGAFCQWSLAHASSASGVSCKLSEEGGREAAQAWAVVYISSFTSFAWGSRGRPLPLRETEQLPVCPLCCHRPRMDDISAV